MPDPVEEAASQIRAIRALMERATIYRAVSAPAAAFAGVLCLGVCGWLWTRRDTPGEPGAAAFLCIWLGVLAVVSVVNVLLLHRSARARGEDFVSPGMKHALRALMPPLAAGFVFSLREVTAGVPGPEGYSGIVTSWILFYGLALLATGSFSPRSMYLLGAVFFAFGLLTLMPVVRDFGGSPYSVAVLHMALSFGALHLIYAAAVWLKGRGDNPAAPSGA